MEKMRGLNLVTSGIPFVKYLSSENNNLWDVVWDPDRTVDKYYRHSTGLLYINHGSEINHHGEVKYRIIGDAKGYVGQFPEINCPNGPQY